MRSHTCWAALCCLATAAVAKFHTVAKQCHPDCTRFGNCNAESGRCECPFGFDGPFCQQSLLPSCHPAPPVGIGGSAPLYGGTFPKHCACLKQLQRLACAGNYSTNFYLCTQAVFWNWKAVRCYEYPGRPEHLQLSDPPERNTTDVVWRKGVWLNVPPGEDPFGLEQIDAAPLRTHEQLVLHPYSLCPDRCSGRGHCFSWFPGDTPHCRCASFYDGPACAAAAAEHCPLGCSGRGACHAGFCHCQPGFWSYGCSRSKAYGAEEWSPHPTQLRVFVYDVPEALAYMRPFSDSWTIHFPIYLAEQEFFTRLLNDSAVRTENPWEANLFFIPTFTYYYIGNVGFPGQQFATVFKWVRESFPFWNMTNGRNHIAVATNDRGACDLYRLPVEVQRPIKLIHFAQSGRGFGRRKGAAAELGALLMAGDGSTVPGHLRARLDDPALQSAAVEFTHLASSLPLRPRFRGFPPFQLEALVMEREPCYRPEHDVAFPNYLPAVPWLQRLPLAYVYGNESGSALSYGDPVRFNRAQQRDLLLSFDGFSKEDMSYSAGVRQAFLAMFGNSTRPDIAINRGKDPGADPSTMLRSRFCFAPLGHGWGVRLSQAVLSGCVPVLVQDHNYPTLWDVLPYESFSVRLARRQLHRLLDMLDDVTPVQMAALQDGLAAAHRAFVWQPEAGGTAYEHTLLSLHRRLINLWTALFK